MGDEPTDSDISAMEAWLDGENDRLQELEALPYDGVLGLPPEWVPEPTVDRFRRIRDELLELSPPKFLAEQIDQILNGNTPIVPGSAYDSVAWMQSIHELAHVRYASKLEPEQGLAVLAGDDATLGYSRRNQVRKFAYSGTETRIETAEQKHAMWQAEADKLKKEKPRIAGNKSQLARLIKNRLNLDDPESTIRQNIH